MPVLITCKFEKDLIKTTEKKWRHRFPHYNGRFLLPWKPEFWPNLSWNLMQHCPHPNNASYKIWMLTWVNSYKSLIQHFRLSFVTATNQNEEFEQLLYAWGRITPQTFIERFCQDTCSEIVIKGYFHFSHKSMETLTCHRNESTWATSIKITHFVRLMLWTFLRSFRRIPLMASEVMIF